MNIIKQLEELKKLSSDIKLAAEDWDENWKILLSTLLSARTRDEVTIPIAQKLFYNYNSIEDLYRAEIEDIQKIIKPINFYKTKSKNLLNCAKTICQKYNGVIPLDFEKLIELPGVGRKTANVFLSEIGKPAIGVDTHVFRIARELGWSKGNRPEEVEEDLKKLFPKNHWVDVNSILVRFGKTYTKKIQFKELINKIKLI